MARPFGRREALIAEDDRLPKRVMQAFASGPLEGVGITEWAFVWFKRRFYELIQWDPATGVPSRKCLRDLDLDRFVDQQDFGN